jgi:hypothetical protein
MLVHSPQGKAPESEWLVKGSLHRRYEKGVKGTVYVLPQQAAAKMVLPRDPLKSLNIDDCCLVFQLYLPIRKPFALELRVTDAGGDRRRLIFSTSFKNVVGGLQCP